MDLTLFVIVMGLFLFVGVFAVAYSISAKTLNLSERVLQIQGATKKVKFDWRTHLKKSERILKPLGKMIPRSPEGMSRQGRRLVQGGIRRKDAGMIFYGVQAAFALVFLTITGFTGYLRESLFVYATLSMFLGVLLPDLWLTQRIRTRNDRIQHGLPDGLDLMVVCVEAGLALDQSIMRIGQEIRMAHPDLSDELRLYSLEVNAGKSRADAL